MPAFLFQDGKVFVDDEVKQKGQPATPPPEPQTLQPVSEFPDVVVVVQKEVRRLDVAHGFYLLMRYGRIRMLNGDKCRHCGVDVRLGVYRQSAAGRGGKTYCLTCAELLHFIERIEDST